ncbi:uncharacterized protein LOC141857245 [Brevipalpus obovatus]|uniref:uncharacterized protein LOC141857245 n=1 Tax=Brevipalpus obovatus TaxID=246614 RepID=UPI003D9F9F0A
MLLKTIFVSFFHLLIIATLNYCSCCHFPFQGFGVYLGKLSDLNDTTPLIRKTIIDRVYNDLKIRLFRSEYVHSFSPSEDEYAIECQDKQTCSWITMHSMLSELPEKDLFISIWSPPYYMKNHRRQLKEEYETSYRYYLNNITQLVQDRFNLTVKQISLANEPENMFAAWDECSMSAAQLCRLVQTYEEDRFKVCPENAYFWVSKIYRDYSYQGIDCRKACEIIISHGYKINYNIFSPNFGRVYYDSEIYKEEYRGNPVWITEISSTYLFSEFTQMQEALDLSDSIVNFVGTTCVQRFYYWSTFTKSKSGESLIWGTKSHHHHVDEIMFPKKYYAYKHFTVAAYGTSNRTDCSTDGYSCLQFDDRKVFVNREIATIDLRSSTKLCCTTDDYDFICQQSDFLPPRSVCSSS